MGPLGTIIGMNLIMQAFARSVFVLNVKGDLFSGADRPLAEICLHDVLFLIVFEEPWP